MALLSYAWGIRLRKPMHGILMSKANCKLERLIDASSRDLHFKVSCEVLALCDKLLRRRHIDVIGIRLWMPGINEVADAGHCGDGCRSEWRAEGFDQ